eukprot:CAMPEP_0202866150 /NCGR_PEP_ID=MMETSP1391-20130828/7229_1 /ASSEMBLY_ACC=CAM_ASM_000867 /TAXON_ID=1034604 /ORGANISM="Chlamydomonas leiostraca, Strain SAG 11-49" /LENGTH=161 /DNA_ID=CAMNT_0049546073 /DNA_START=150 /DNA_END=635 /DNA_ORIENTATION=-
MAQVLGAMQRPCIARARPGSTAASMQRPTLAVCPGKGRRQIHSSLVVYGKKGEDGGSQIVDTVVGVVDSVASLVPESVPRPVARGGVALAGTLLVFGLLKQVISGIVTLVVMGGVAYWWLTKDDKGDESTIDVKPSKPSGKKADLDDPLSQADEIMKKYKK